MDIRRTSLGLILWLVAACCFAQTTSSQQRIYLAEDSQVLPHRYNSIDNWLSQLQAVDAIKLTDGSYWLVKPIHIKQASKWMVSVEGSLIQDIDFYLYSEHNQIQHVDSGYTAPYHYPFTYARNIDTPQLGKYWLIARISSDAFTGSPELVFETQKQLVPHYHWRANLITLCLGGLIVLALYNGGIALLQRDSLFGYFAALLVVFAASQALRFALTPRLMGLYILVQMALPIFLIFFYRQFQQLDQRAPKLYILSNIALWLVVLQAPFAYLQPQWITVVAQGMLISCLVLAFSSAIVLRRQRFYPCRLFMLGCLMWLIPLAQRVLAESNHHVEAIWGSDILCLFVGLSNALLLSLALSYRFKEIKDQQKIVSEQLLQERDAARLEPLTGLQNRYAFNEYTQAMTFGQAPATILALVDIDYLKKVNDQFGHQEGDQLIRLVAEALQLSIKDKGEIFRIGGDEFAVCSQDLSPAALSEKLSIADKIVKLNGSSLQSGISYGSANSLDCKSLEQLVYQADMAMYTNKKQRKQAKVVPLTSSIS